MSYTVLAVKWRPRRFETLVGQADVVRALVNSLAAERLHHAYLFTGTRGVGKTTIARILAKALNCENGVSPEPCGECGACASIDQGRFVDLIEVDAASRTRVDDTRELLDNVQYMPTRGRFKVYLIDEVHMLSTHSFNALLKTLEEPPPHVKFLFATTDPQKLPVTVLSRCLQFNLRKLSPTQITEQLAHITQTEGVSADDQALKSIAVAAAGSMRDALSLLDQAIAFGAGSVTAVDVSQMLGSIDRSQVAAMLRSLAEADGAQLLNWVEQLDQQGVEFGVVLDELMGALQRIAVTQLVQERELSDMDADLEGLAEAFAPEQIQLLYQIALGGRRDIAVCRDERMSFEMTLLRMLAFQPVAPGKGHAETSQRQVPQAGRRAGSASAKAVGPASSMAIDPASSKAAAVSRKADAAEVPVDAGNAVEWSELVRRARLRGAVRNLADHCEIASIEGSRYELVLQRDKADFNTDQLRQRLAESLGKYLGQNVSLKISLGDPPRHTPAQHRQANEDERMRETREAIERDPNIQAVQKAFGAVLEPDSIQPARVHNRDN